MLTTNNLTLVCFIAHEKSDTLRKEAQSWRLLHEDQDKHPFWGEKIKRGALWLQQHKMSAGLPTNILNKPFSVVGGEKS